VKSKRPDPWWGEAPEKRSMFATRVCYAIGRGLGLKAAEPWPIAYHP
jgi:hypothetical protein